MNRELGPRSGRREFGFVVALLLVALLPRLYVAVAWSREPVWDGHYYHFGAERIAAGLGYSEDVWIGGARAWRPWIHYPVGYSGLLAGFYALFGSQLVIAPLLNAVFGAALAGIAYGIALPFLGLWRARLAGALVAVHPGLIAYSALVMTEVVAAALLCAAGLLLITWRGRYRGVVLAGLCLGCATLVRPTSLIALPLVLLIEPGSLLRRIARGALLGGCTLLVLLPWTLRNCQRFDGCALVSTNGGWNLAIGAITKTGRFETLRASDGCAVATGQVQQDRCWAEVGWRKIRENPAAFLRIIPKKWSETFSHESFAVEYLHEADPVSWTESRRVAGRELMSAAHRLLLLVAAFGVVSWPGALRGDRWAFGVQLALLAVALALGVRSFVGWDYPVHWLVLFIAVVGFLPLPGRPVSSESGSFVIGTIAGVLLTHALFFGEDRYHLVASPLFCVLAAGALRRPARAAAPSRI